MENVLACRDSHTWEQYNTNREALMALTDGLMIRPGRVKNEVSFRNYYDVNWECIQPMWVLAFRKKLPLQVNMNYLCVLIDLYCSMLTPNRQIMVNKKRLSV